MEFRTGRHRCTGARPFCSGDANPSLRQSGKTYENQGALIDRSNMGELRLSTIREEVQLGTQWRGGRDPSSGEYISVNTEIT